MPAYLRLQLEPLALPRPALVGYLLPHRLASGDIRSSLKAHPIIPRGLLQLLVLLQLLQRSIDLSILTPRFARASDA
jgi:hypothetical protein